MIKITGVFHLGLPVNDLERATKFYTEVFGMRCTKNMGFDVEDTGRPYKEVYGEFPRNSRVFMEDGTALVLYQRPKALERGELEDGLAHVALLTSKEDFDRAVQEIKKRGLRMLPDKVMAVPSREGRSMYFFDPEGNYIQLHCLD